MKGSKGSAAGLFGPMSFTGGRIASCRKEKGGVEWVVCSYAVMEQVEEVVRSGLLLSAACWV